MATTTTRPSTANPDTLVRVGPRDQLAAVTVVSGGRHGIAVFAPAGSDAIYAVDNRCPQMGFPLHQGSVCDGILTCHWHHARFDLESGGTFDQFADDVQTYEVIVQDDEVYVDPRPRRHDRVGHARAWSSRSVWCSPRTCSPCSKPVSRRPASSRSAVRSAPVTGKPAGDRA